MVRADYGTEEDAALSSNYRLYKGQRIDIRWSGGWLTPTGKYFPVDYKNGITHETIADEEIRGEPEPHHNDRRTSMMRMFDKRWMRISYFENSSFCVDIKGSLLAQYGREDRRSALLRFATDFKHFDAYYINDVRHNSYLEFIAAIRANDVQPTKFTPAVREAMVARHNERLRQITEANRVVIEQFLRTLANSETQMPQDLFPDVTVNEIIGLLKYLEKEGPQDDIYRIGNAIDSEMGRIFDVVFAAERLDFVGTPEELFILRPMGKRFVHATALEQQAMWRKQLMTFPWFQPIHDLLKLEPTHTAMIASAMEELAENGFHQFVAWAQLFNVYALHETNPMRLLE